MGNEQGLCGGPKQQKQYYNMRPERRPPQMRKRETWELESDEEMKGSTASATASTPSYKRAKSQHIGEVGKVSRLERD